MGEFPINTVQHEEDMTREATRKIRGEDRTTGPCTVKTQSRDLNTGVRG